jgi:hypothetical protein
MQDAQPVPHLADVGTVVHPRPQRISLRPRKKNQSKPTAGLPRARVTSHVNAWQLCWRHIGGGAGRIGACACPILSEGRTAQGTLLWCCVVVSRCATTTILLSYFPPLPRVQIWTVAPKRAHTQLRTTDNGSNWDGRTKKSMRTTVQTARVLSRNKRQ